MQQHGGSLQLAAVTGVETAGGRVTALRVRDSASGEERTLPADAVVFAMGEWADEGWPGRWAAARVAMCWAAATLLASRCATSCPACCPPPAGRRLVQPAGLLAARQLPRRVFWAQGAQHCAGRPAAAHHRGCTLPGLQVGGSERAAPHAAAAAGAGLRGARRGHCARCAGNHTDATPRAEAPPKQCLLAGGRMASHWSRRFTPDPTARYAAVLPSFLHCWLHFAARLAASQPATVVPSTAAARMPLPLQVYICGCSDEGAPVPPTAADVQPRPEAIETLRGVAASVSQVGAQHACCACASLRLH